MKTLTRVAFCVTLALGVGCAVTDYGTITDNDQLHTPQPDGFVVNTNGKAFYQECSTAATIWPDGYDELLTWVDQKADATATLTTYNNHSTFDEPWSSDELYCNPDWQGCSIFTAPDNNDSNLFDGRLNENCYGARSLSVLLSTGRYYGECGRRSRLRGEERLALIGAAQLSTRYGSEGLLWKLDHRNLTIVLENENGERFQVPILGSSEAWISGDPGHRATFDLTDPLLGRTVSWYANFQDRRATEKTQVIACYSGICAETTIAGKHPVTSGARIRAVKNARF